MPIILRSGDVLIMSGRGRQSYHGKQSNGQSSFLLIRRPGVPRVMEGTLPSHFFPATSDLHTLAATKKWITTGRININARQVFPPGFQRPSPVG